MIWKLEKKKEKTSIYRYELFFLWTWHTHTQDAWMELNRWKVVLAFAIYRSRFIIKYTHFIRASCLFSCLLLHIFSNMWVICAHIDVAFFYYNHHSREEKKTVILVLFIKCNWKSMDFVFVLDASWLSVEAFGFYSQKIEMHLGNLRFLIVNYDWLSVFHWKHYTINWCIQMPSQFGPFFVLDRFSWVIANVEWFTTSIWLNVWLNSPTSNFNSIL